MHAQDVNNLFDAVGTLYGNSNSRQQMLQQMGQPKRCALLSLPCLYTDMVH